MKKNVLYAFLSFFIPNMLMLFIGYEFGLVRPIFNIDYSLPAVFFSFGFSWTGCFFAFIFLTVDFLSLVGQLFPFVRVQDFFYLMSFFSFSSTFYKGLFFVCVLCIFLLVFVIQTFGKRACRLSSLALFNLSIFIYILSNYFLFPVVGDKYWKPVEKPFSSQVEYFFVNRYTGFSSNFLSSPEPLVDYMGDAATDQWRGKIESGELSDKLLLIVAESWGVSADSSVNKAIIDPILRNSDFTDIELGEIVFSGATVEGELRELCKLEPGNFNLRDVQERFDGCFPNVLKSKGYAVAAQHGAVSNMYDRRYWYPRAGLDDSTFYEDKIWPRRCYSFPGACDIDMMGEVEDFFRDNEKGFYYWLTLNSHSSYDMRDIFVDKFYCQGFGIGEGESCRNLKIQAQFFFELSRLLSEEAMESVEVLVVGDHEPRGLDQNEMGEIFHKGKVPWLRFRVES